MSSAVSAPPRRTAVWWLLPFASVGVVLVLRLAFSPLIGTTAPFMLFVLAIAPCAWLGGLGPGLLATALAGASGVGIVLAAGGTAPLYDPVQLLQLIFFLIAGSAISGIAEATLRARASLVAAERKAREEHEWLQVVLRSVGDGVIATDERGHVRLMNPAAEQMTGFRSTEAAGQPLEAVFRTVNERPRAAAALLAAGIAPQSILVRRDGSQTPISASSAPIRDGAGRSVGVVVIFLDDSARRAAEAERERLLREVETERNRLAEVLRQAPSFMVTLRGPYLVYELENELHRQLIGHRDVIGKTVREALPEVAAQGFVDVLDGVYRTGKPFIAHGLPVALARKPGEPPEERLLDFVYQPFRDAEGKITGILAQGVDQTERVRAEQQLRKAQALTQSIIDGSPALIFVKDLDGRYLLANRAWGQLAGVPPDQARGRTDEEFFGPEAGQRIRAVDLQVLSGSPLVVEEHVVVGGQRRTFLSHKFPLRDEEGRVSAVCGVSPEISALKETEAALRDAERKLRELNEVLEHRVRERTAQLEAANRELEAFSYSVSHDLRAPLRGVDGFSKLLLDEYGGKLDAEGRRYLDRVRAGTQRMGTLIDDLLRLARVSRAQLERAPVDLGALALDVAEELRRANPGRDVELVIARPAPAVGDAQLLRVVLENLLGNAFKFTGKTPHARIEFGERSAEGVRSFFVRDNGAGFDMEYSKKLFGAFQRLHSTTEFEGTGIGLATVQRIVARHGGRIWGEGAPNQGATFFFTLEEPSPS